MLPYVTALYNVLLSRQDGTWSGTWKPPYGVRYIEYKYCIHDGFDITDDCYEWLGSTPGYGYGYSYPINRSLSLSGKFC